MSIWHRVMCKHLIIFFRMHADNDMFYSSDARARKSTLSVPDTHFSLVLGSSLARMLWVVTMALLGGCYGVCVCVCVVSMYTQIFKNLKYEKV